MDGSVATTRRYRPSSVLVVSAILVVALIARVPLASALDIPVVHTWSTIFIAICFQAAPFVMLGSLVSAAIYAFVPERFFAAISPRSPVAAVPVFGLAGMVMPGCECGSVPIARRLADRGIRPSAALAFMLSSPAVNPVVLAATAVAFAGDLRMMWVRLIGGFTVALIVGLIWEYVGRPEWLTPRRRAHAHTGSRTSNFTDSVRSDFADAMGFLVIGAALAATFKAAIPTRWLDHVGANLLVSVLVMAVLAVVLALCSEADAFVVAGMPGIPLAAKAVFLVVGPAVDIKLIAMHAGLLGRSFAARFAPLVLVVSTVVGTVTGLVIFGSS